MWGGHIRIAAALMAALLVSSCSETSRTGQGSAYLLLNSLTAAPGGGTNANKFGTSLESDVQTVVAGVPSIFADSGQATLQLQMKDALETPGPSQAVTLTQYHVKFTRTDGHNVQGVDVPYEFDGALAVTVSGTATVSFTLVRVQAKQDAPLAALVNNLGRVLSTIAEVTFYGKDQVGNAVTVSGNVNVDFSNWGD